MAAVNVLLDSEMDIVACDVADAVIMWRLSVLTPDARRRIINARESRRTWKTSWEGVYTEAMRSMRETNFRNYNYFDLCTNALLYNEHVMVMEERPCLRLLEFEWGNLDEWGVVIEGEGAMPSGWEELREIRMRARWLGVTLGYLT